LAQVMLAKPPLRNRIRFHDMSNKVLLRALILTLSACKSGASCGALEHGDGLCPEPGTALLQHKFHKDIEKATIHELVAAQENSALTQPAVSEGLKKFWTIALVSYGVSVVFAATVYWLILRSKRRRNEEIDAADAEGEKDTKSAVDTLKNDIKEESLKTCAVALFIIGCTMVVYSVLRFLPRPDCAPLKYDVHIPEMVALSVIFTLTAWCWCVPRYYVYWPTLACFLLYMPAITLPPFNLSCLELQQCKGSTHWRFSNAVHHADCSLQGQTAQQIFLNFFLLSPWLLPEETSMHLMWIWIFSVYVVWSVAYFRYSDDGLTSFDNVDVMARFALLSVTLIAASFKKHYLQRSQKKRYVSDLKRREDSNKLYTILQYMLPEHVIEPMLMDPGSTIAEAIDTVSILFILIEDFETIAAEKTPKEVLGFLREKYTAFDKICSRNHVTKLETVSEEYVCCVGVTPDDVTEKQDPNSNGHTDGLERLFKVAEQILALQTETEKFRMGIHTGPIVTGVIGQKLPRFRLFGDTINTAARMMQKGAAGKVQFGEATYEYLPDGIKALTERLKEPVEMKGKGKVQTFLFGLDTGLGSQSPMTTRSTVNLGGGMLLDFLLERDLSDASGGEFTDSDQESDDPDGRTGLALIQSKLKKTVDRIKTETISQARRLKKRTGGWILSEKAGFTAEMEIEWRKSFHEEQVLFRIKDRLALYFLAVFVITVIETLWNIPSPSQPNSGWMLEHDRFEKQNRVPIFLGCRLLIILIIAALGYSVVMHQWPRNRPEVFQWWLVASSCVIAVAFYLSYDVMIVGKNETPELRVHAPFDQIFSLFFVLVFFCIIRMFRVLFYQSLVFVPVAVLIAIYANYPTWSGVYMPAIGQVLFVFIAISCAVLTHAEEQALRARYMAQHATTTTNNRVNAILNTMMPPLVLKEVKQSTSSALPHHSYEMATVAQSDLCGFTKLASKRAPQEVVKFITEIFGCFDRLTDKYGVYKVETVGDAYIGAQAEYPLTVKNSPSSVIQFGISMVFEVQAWSKRIGEEVRCRVGVHYGSCVGGIVDMHMQAYHLFGHFMQEVEVLESTAPEGGVQVSKACHGAVLRERKEDRGGEHPFEFREVKGAHLVTSKGEVHEFEEVGGRSFVLEGPGMNTPRSVIEEGRSQPKISFR